MEKDDAGSLAERLFERYLTERSYSWEYEPDLGIAARPDYYVLAGGHEIVCEVKAFETAVFAGKIGSRSAEDALKPIRRQIRGAAGQLKGLQGRPSPLVVVLSNPLRYAVPLDPPAVIGAMYGDLTGEAIMNPDGSLGEFFWGLGRNGKLRNDHPYVSAVAVVRRTADAVPWVEEWKQENRKNYPDEDSFRAALIEALLAEGPVTERVSLDVFETLSSQAVPLPRDVFNGPGDRRWGPDKDRTGLIEISPT